MQALLRLLEHYQFFGYVSRDPSYEVISSFVFQLNIGGVGSELNFFSNIHKSS